jgi:hypothetical protein
MGVLGTALLAGGFLAGSEELRVLGGIVLGMALVVFGAGVRRQRNRLAVYAGGLVQVRRGMAEPLLWLDVQAVVLERQRHYHNLGLYKTVRTACHVQRRDGAWVAVDVVPVTGEVMRALRQSCEGAGLAWQEEGRERWSL